MIVKKNKKDNSSAEVEKLGDLRFISLDLIADKKEIKNRTIDKEHVEFLREAILKDGLISPLTVWDGGNAENMMSVRIDGEKQQAPATFLVAGFHRRAALREIRENDSAKFKKLFPDGVPVHVIHGDIQDALIAQLTENVARSNPSAAEVLPFIKRLLDDGMKRGAIAKRIGKSASYISEVMSIEEELGEDAAEDLEKGDIDLAEGLKAAKKVKKGGDKKKALEEARAKTKKKKDSGKVRAEKRKSLKTLYGMYEALPNMTLGKRLGILEDIVKYSVGKKDELPEDLDIEEEEDDEDDEKSAKKKKKGKK